MEEEKIVEAAARKAGSLNKPSATNGASEMNGEKRTHRVESDEDLKLPRVNGHGKAQTVSA